MKISFAITGLVAANPATYNNNGMNNNYNQATANYNQANNAYPSQPGTYGATSYGSTGYGKGLSCWTCDAYSFDDCHKKGKLRKCNANEVWNKFVTLKLTYNLRISLITSRDRLKLLFHLRKIGRKKAHFRLTIWFKNIKF